MQDKTALTEIHPSIKRSKLETPYDAGDCGYYTLCVGLLYLAMQAKTDPELAVTISNSDALSNLLSTMPMLSGLIDVDNLQRIDKILTELSSSNWDKISFKELLNEFSNGVRSILATSEWGLSYFKTILKEGGWILDNQKWMSLPTFKRLESKILGEMEVLAQDQLVGIEEAGALRFQATLKIFNELPDKILEDMARNVAQRYYGPGSEKAWLDSEFLKYLSQQLIPSPENLFFNPNGVEINSNGPSTTHWYIDVPENQITDSLLNIANAGHSKDLKKIEVYTVRNITTDGMASLIQQQEELLQRQVQLTGDFEKLILTLQDHMYATSIDSSVFPEEYLAKVSKLEPTANQAAIDEALIPIIAIDESYISEYQELSVVKNHIADINEKIKRNRQTIESRIDTISGQLLIKSGLFNPTSEQPEVLEKQTKDPESSKQP